MESTEAAMGRLRDLIHADPRSTPKIAAAAGLARNHLYQILDGSRRPKFETVIALMVALGKPFASLDPDRADVR